MQHSIFKLSQESENSHNDVCMMCMSDLMSHLICNHIQEQTVKFQR